MGFCGVFFQGCAFKDDTQPQGEQHAVPDAEVGGVLGVHHVSVEPHSHHHGPLPHRLRARRRGRDVPQEETGSWSTKYHSTTVTYLMWFA